MKVVVIGGGPAGMIAAITACQKGDEVVLIEKNNTLGKKLLKAKNSKNTSVNLNEIIQNTLFGIVNLFPIQKQINLYVNYGIVVIKYGKSRW